LTQKGSKDALKTPETQGEVLINFSAITLICPLMAVRKKFKKLHWLLFPDQTVASFDLDR